MTKTQTASKTHVQPAGFDVARHRDRIVRTISKKSFCTMATTSAAGRPHSAGVVYNWVDGAMWVHAAKTSRKGRNIAGNSHVGICIPFRRMPVGPPYTIHFQASAEFVEMDAPEALALLDAGRLDKIAGHGALDMEDAAFIKITPTGNVHSFGPGVKMLDLIRNPLTSGARTVNLATGGQS